MRPSTARVFRYPGWTSSRVATLHVCIASSSSFFKAAIISVLDATVRVSDRLRAHCPQVFDKMEVFTDDGITSGSDLFKALSLGAKAVAVERDLFYAMNYGREGFKRYLNSSFAFR